MSLLAYIRDPSHNFSATEQRYLSQWYGQFASDPAWLLIQRNVDRECARNDIYHPTYIHYLRQLSRCYRIASPAPDPTSFMDKACKLAPSAYRLAGHPLPSTGERLIRCMRVDSLMKHNLYEAAIPITDDMPEVIQKLKNRTLNAAALVGSTLGESGYPVWVSPERDIRPPLSADHLRDLLGLQHIQHGHMAKLIYPESVLASGTAGLRAPTILDAIAKGARNWVFAKRVHPGGPSWGHTIDLSSQRTGVREAVHFPFDITSSSVSGASPMSLDYVGLISRTPYAVNFVQLFNNT